MNNLYEALEICLQDIEQGADMETVLFRYPDLADELRPILEASAGAKSMAVPDPSPEIVRRNRARVMQHAAQMREVKASSSQRMWFASLRRVAVTLVVVAALFVSGTGLVRAASTTVPGDDLYPVKRTWEDVLLLFTFNMQQRAALEIEHENERLHELQELFAKGRSAEVDFAGRVTSQTGNEWMVSGVRVVISDQTEMRDGPIAVGSAVRVRGQTQGSDTVLAERIRLLSSNDQLPDIEYEHEGEEESSNEGSNQQNEDNSGPGSGEEMPRVEETETPEPESGPKEESFDGVVISVDNNVLVVNGIVIDISNAEEIKGTPVVGVPVKVEGYYDSNGVFIVTKIEFENNSTEDNSGSGSSNDSSGEGNNTDDGGNSSDSGGEDNSNTDHGDNVNSGEDSSNNDSGNDSGGGDNSGPGGGGNDNGGGED